MTRAKWLPGTALHLRRLFGVPRERLFRAWTEPRELKKWWRIGKGWTTEIAAVDLRVGGEFRLGTKPPGQPAGHMVHGVFWEVIPPAKLVYTWLVEGAPPSEESLVTVEFRQRGRSTELVLTHQALASGRLRQLVRTGWVSVLRQLAGLLKSTQTDR